LFFRTITQLAKVVSPAVLRQLEAHRALQASYNRSAAQRETLIASVRECTHTLLQIPAAVQLLCPPPPPQSPQQIAAQHGQPVQLQIQPGPLGALVGGVVGLRGLLHRHLLTTVAEDTERAARVATLQAQDTSIRAEMTDLDAALAALNNQVGKKSMSRAIFFINIFLGFAQRAKKQADADQIVGQLADEIAHLNGLADNFVERVERDVNHKIQLEQVVFVILCSSSFFFVAAPLTLWWNKRGRKASVQKNSSKKRQRRGSRQLPASSSTKMTRRICARRFSKWSRKSAPGSPNTMRYVCRCHLTFYTYTH
jgi:hypothetical protein